MHIEYGSADKQLNETEKFSSLVDTISASILPPHWKDLFDLEKEKFIQKKYPQLRAYLGAIPGATMDIYIEQTIRTWWKQTWQLFSYHRFKKIIQQQGDDGAPTFPQFIQEKGPKNTPLSTFMLWRYIENHGFAKEVRVKYKDQSSGNFVISGFTENAELIIINADTGKKLPPRGRSDGRSGVRNPVNFIRTDEPNDNPQKLVVINESYPKDDLSVEEMNLVKSGEMDISLEE